MKELVITSGKGGTGKTSIVGGLAALAKGAVLADCDVDAPDLHLVLNPTIERTEPFSGGRRAEVRAADCTGCGACAELCVFNAIGPDASDSNGAYRVDPVGCEGCGVCAWFCPEKAIDMDAADNGQSFVSRTRFGAMAHARLHAAEENSGKLVTVVRKKAKELAERDGSQLIICDGPPGIGCPVIASVVDADMVLVVTEPTLSGMHDLERVRELTRHFNVDTVVCVNKYDLNIEITEQIEAMAAKADAEVVGRIRYDAAVTKAQIQKQTVVEYTAAGVAKDIRDMWARLAPRLV